MNPFTGVPTLTTPTLTPTTLRTIEQILLPNNNNSPPSEGQGGTFIPPLPPITNTVSWNGGRILEADEPMEENTVVNTKPTKTNKRGGKRSTGGRKPANRSNVTPEEDERRKIRRERNKQAAARCRKRRVDHTNTLQMETDDLERQKKAIQDQINFLTHEREELEYILQNHQNNCTKKRPTSLQFKIKEEQELITPSNGLNLELDWSSLPSTGLTPTALNPVTPLITPNTVGAILHGLGETGGHSKIEEL